MLIPRLSVLRVNKALRIVEGEMIYSLQLSKHRRQRRMTLRCYGCIGL